MQYFEILKEKYPDLVLSFEDILRVGQAYRDIQEYERAVQVFRATIEASFLKDVQVSGTLEAQGELRLRWNTPRDLIAEYPTKHSGDEASARADAVVIHSGGTDAAKP